MGPRKISPDLTLTFLRKRPGNKFKKTIQFFIMEEIILVDEQDNEIGFGEKMQVHKEARLHRAFSVFVFNSRGEMLLQKRASGKYHCGGLWTNTVCSHPRKGERLEEAVHRRLQEEMGFDTELKKTFHFTYRALFDNGLTEHEFDHVFIGTFEGEPKPNPEEVGEWKWASPEEVQKDVKEHPEKYTPWFKLVLERVLNFTNQ